MGGVVVVYIRRIFQKPQNIPEASEYSGSRHSRHPATLHSLHEPIALLHEASVGLHDAVASGVVVIRQQSALRAGVLAHVLKHRTNINLIFALVTMSESTKKQTIHIDVCM
jgi:hypothetical protein